MAPAHVQNSDRICAPPGIVATRREQLRAQQQRYESETVDLKAENKRLKRAVAAAHGELRRCGHTGT
jgi:hypothetical protein